MTSTVTYSRAHSVTYVADNIIKSLKDIIRLSGLNPTEFVNDRDSYDRAISTWLASQDLTKITLEIYNPLTDKLILRWDIEVQYNWSTGDGSFWMDTDQLSFAFKKAGVAPSSAKYSVILTANPNRPHVDGWSYGAFRSTNDMIRQSLGATIEHNGLGANTSYWRQVS